MRHRIRLIAPVLFASKSVHQKIKRELDPLDLEIFGKGLESARAAFKEKAGAAEYR